MASASRLPGVAKRDASCAHTPQNRMRDSMNKTFGTEIVTVNAGPDAEPFHIHKNLITHWSRYFHNAFKGGFRETEEEVITLDDVEPLLFKIVMEWLDTQKLALENREEAFVERLKGMELHFAEKKHDEVTASARERDEVTAPASLGGSDDVTDMPSASEVTGIVPQQDPIRTSGKTDRKRPFLCFKSPKDNAVRNTAFHSIEHVAVLVRTLSPAETADKLLRTFDALNLALDSLEAIFMDIPYTILHNSRILKDLKRLRDFSHSEFPVHTRIIQKQAKRLLRAWQRIPYSVLVDLYIFADKYDFPQLRYDIMDAIHVKSSIHFVPDIHAVVKAFDNLPNTSGLYPYFFESWACDWNGQHRKIGNPSETIEELLPKALVLEIMVRRSRALSLIHRSPGQILPEEPHDYDVCRYHDHPQQARNESRLNAAVRGA
ncbi:hypothetical protein BU16DRAFT_615084 [Lophium mytilinum]|uniref:BTB domain-containing protein n=1 Tax=Lophium mytilinum TaxID=390894 RepID=A0A6A6R8C8_9PEZI|nr:hypothetical protein BU16DRAFT_615084 [Lophium mytilinum]